jgi:hypothetical protein
MHHKRERNCFGSDNESAASSGNALLQPSDCAALSTKKPVLDLRSEVDSARLEVIQNTGIRACGPHRSGASLGRLAVAIQYSNNIP